MPDLPSGLKITWLGHATFRFETSSGKRILIDPFLKNNPKCPEGEKTQENLDLILVTHGHGDHIDDLIETAQGGAKVIAMVELANWLSGQGIDNVVEMNKGGTVDADGIKVHMTHAIHSAGIETPEGVIYGGEPAGYVIEFEDGFKIYHAGDTCVFSDMALIAKLLEPDIALLPIGDHFTMGPRSAAEAIRLLRVNTVIPMHYGTFGLLHGTPEQLRKETVDIEGLEIIEMEPGQTLG